MFGFGKKLSVAKNAEWGFKELSPEDYRILIAFQVESDYFKKVLRKNSLEKVGNELLQRAEEIKQFSFTPEHLKLSKTYLAPAMKEIGKMLEGQGVAIYNYEVRGESKYNVVGELFHCYFIVEGQYAKK
jgi:hypothetical protein